MGREKIEREKGGNWMTTIEVVDEMVLRTLQGFEFLLLGYQCVAVPTFSSAWPAAFQTPGYIGQQQKKIKFSKIINLIIDLTLLGYLYVRVLVSSGQTFFRGISVQQKK